MHEPDERNASEHVDLEFRPFVQYLRAELGQEHTIVEQVEDERRTQTVVIVNPARVWTRRVPLRAGGHTFHPPQIPTDRATFLRHLLGLD